MPSRHGIWRKPKWNYKIDDVYTYLLFIHSSADAISVKN